MRLVAVSKERGLLRGGERAEALSLQHLVYDSAVYANALPLLRCHDSEPSLDKPPQPHETAAFVGQLFNDNGDLFGVNRLEIVNSCMPKLYSRPPPKLFPAKTAVCEVGCLFSSCYCIPRVSFFLSFFFVSPYSPALSLSHSPPQGRSGYGSAGSHASKLQQ